MKTLENKGFMFKGKPVTGEGNSELKTMELIQVILENSQYTTSKDLLRAAKVLGTLKVVDDKINLEDEDFKFVKQWADTYTPVVSKGLIFADFYQQLED